MNHPQPSHPPITLEISKFPTPAGKFECLDTAEAVSFYKVEGEMKENILTFSYEHHPSRQVNLSGFGSFCWWK